jgi:hypothetical protein
LPERALSADVVQQQLDAYNRRDLNAFLACYSPSAKMATHDGEILAQGMDAFRQLYAASFSRSSWQPVALGGRLVSDTWVVDHEILAAGETIAGREALIAYRLSSERLIEEVLVLR